MSPWWFYQFTGLAVSKVQNVISQVMEIIECTVLVIEGICDPLISRWAAFQFSNFVNRYTLLILKTGVNGSLTKAVLIIEIISWTTQTIITIVTTARILLLHQIHLNLILIRSLYRSLTLRLEVVIASTEWIIGGCYTLHNALVNKVLFHHYGETVLHCIFTPDLILIQAILLKQLIFHFRSRISRITTYNHQKRPKDQSGKRYKNCFPYCTPICLIRFILLRNSINYMHFFHIITDVGITYIRNHPNC